MSYGLVFRDAGKPGCFLEYFLAEGWLQHLRHYERVTEADRLMQANVNAFHVGEGPPRVTHLVAAQ